MAQPAQEARQTKAEPPTVTEEFGCVGDARKLSTCVTSAQFSTGIDRFFAWEPLNPGSPPVHGLRGVLVAQRWSPRIAPSDWLPAPQGASNAD